MHNLHSIVAAKVICAHEVLPRRRLVNLIHAWVVVEWEDVGADEGH